MKTASKNAIREEGGKILILVLVLLVVGGLLLTPLLGLMSTGLVAGQVYEKKAAELYAADAGVESAIWRIQSLQTNPLEWSGNRSQLAPLSVNDKAVDVDIYRTQVDGKTHCHIVYMYQILSTAEGLAGSATSVEAVLKSVALNFSGLAGNAITSDGDVTIMGQQGQVVGDISLPPEPYAYLSPPGYVPQDGEVKRELLSWPTAKELIEFYLADVNVNAPYGSNEVDLRGGDGNLGPLYCSGPLDIKNSKQSNDTPSLTLTGTLYVKGVTTIKPTQEMILNLNGHTMFIESASVFYKNEPYALYVGSGGSAADPKIKVQGPGAIIAVGEIYFEPNMVGGEPGGVGGPIMVYSVSSSTHFQPGGTFYGSILGNSEVYLSPGNTIVYPNDGLGEINFPGLRELKETYSLESWQIK